MDYFRDLGARVERRWRAAGCDDRAFSTIAMEELERTPAHRNVSNDDILEWCNRPGSDLPAQVDIQANFGDPPVTVLRGHRMHIDVNFWLSSTTTIHEHGFDGAFQVLEGSSVHTRYDFVEQRRYNADACIGELTGRTPEVLGPGDTHAIVAGPDFIHGLFHLEAPSSTVVVRTETNRLVGIQRNFYKPGLAVDGFNVDPTARRSAQIATMMCLTSNPRVEGWLTRYFESAGPREAHLMLIAISHGWKQVRGATPERLDELLDPFVRLVERRSWWGAVVSAAFRAERETRGFTSARSSVTDPDRRFFLALLANVPRSSDVFRLVKQRYPEDDPVEKVFGWVAELCTPKGPLGLTVNGSMLLVARRLAEGRPLAAIAAELNTTRTKPATLKDLRAAEAELRGSCLALLFPSAPARAARAP